MLIPIGVTKLMSHMMIGAGMQLGRPISKHGPQLH